MKPYNQTESKKEQVRTMFDGIARRYDLLNHLLSLGIDRGWRRRVVRMVRLHRPAEILDMATGTGDLAIMLAEACPAAQITGIDLYGKTLGIVGLGAIGKCVARRARGFDMKILAHDIAWDEAYAQEAGIERADVDRICREADFITLHTLLTDETRNLINAQRLAAMKKTAVLINTARGGLIDEDALLAALREGRIHGAGLDVFEQEPPANPAWYALDNLVMGSHCSSSTAGATEQMGRMAVANLLRDLALR